MIQTWHSVLDFHKYFSEICNIGPRGLEQLHKSIKTKIGNPEREDHGKNKSTECS